MLHEHVQPVSRMIFAVVKEHMVTGWSKQKWMSLRAQSKVPNRAGFFFPWAKSISISYNVFLWPSHLPVFPQRRFSWGMLRSAVIHGVALCVVRGLNPCSVLRGGHTGARAVPVCPGPSQAGRVWWGPRVGLGTSPSCLGVLPLSSSSTSEMAEATDAKHLVNSVGVEFAMLQIFWERVLTGEGYLK